MAFHFILDVDKKWCVGNTLSTLSANFISLDTNLYNLSTYTISNINLLQTEIQSATALFQTQVNFLSTKVQSVSATLATQINFVSANVINNYLTPTTLTQNSDGTIDWNFINGRNAQVTISKSGKINNPANSLNGDSGNLVISTSVSGALISAFGSNWTIGDAISAFTYTLSSKHLLSYYYDNSKYIFNVINY